MQRRFASTRRVRRRNWGGEFRYFSKYKYLQSNPNSILLVQDSKKISPPRPFTSESNLDGPFVEAEAKGEVKTGRDGSEVNKLIPPTECGGRGLYKIWVILEAVLGVRMDSRGLWRNNCWGSDCRVQGLLYLVVFQWDTLGSEGFERT